MTPSASRWSSRVGQPGQVVARTARCSRRSRTSAAAAASRARAAGAGRAGAGRRGGRRTRGPRGRPAGAPRRRARRRRGEPVEQVTPPAVQAELERLAPGLAETGRHLGRGRLYVVGGPIGCIQTHRAGGRPTATPYLEPMPLPRRAGPPRSLVRPVLLLALRRLHGRDDEPAPEAEPSTPSTPLASYDADTRGAAAGTVLRADPGDARSTEALDGEAPRASAYDNGQRARMTEDVRDVAHEYGCTYEGEDGTSRGPGCSLPPVTTDRATDLVRLARARRGLRAGAGRRGVRPGVGGGRLRGVGHGDGVLPRAVRRHLAELLGRRTHRRRRPGRPGRPRRPVVRPGRRSRRASAGSRPSSGSVVEEGAQRLSRNHPTSVET